MNCLKYSLIFLVLFAATVFAANSSVGKRDCQHDELLMEENIEVNAIPYEFVKHEVKFPKDGEANNKIINAIYVYDRTSDKPGVTSQIYTGGVGYRYARGILKSQFGKGIHATIRVYGR